MSTEPRINVKFPIKENNQLSPPIVGHPIHQCAEVVHVSGFVPHATVRVYSNLNNLVGEDSPPFGFGDIGLNRKLNLGESITATQTVQNITSSHSIQPVVVSDYLPDYPDLPKPVVDNDIFECGRIVPVGNLVPSVIVHVMEEGGEIGAEPTAGTWQPVFTKSLDANRKVTAVQVACEDIPAHALKSLESDPVLVKPTPNPVPSPDVDPQSLIVGNDTVTLTNLYCGANVTVFDNGAPIGGGYATGSVNWCPINTPLQATSSISAGQKLCQASPPSKPITPVGTLNAPVVLGPICAGARFVIIRATTVNANVILLRGGQIIGYGGAAPGDLLLGIGGNIQLQAGDVITAIQTMGSIISPVSNTVTVVAKLDVPSIEILGGEPFFLPEATDQAIDGPVFPRGRGQGPLIKIQSCCIKGMSVEILDLNGNVISKLQPVEVYPGYYTAQWDWHSLQNWNVPSDIPIGAYTVVVKTECDQKEGRATFYVIFNPEDVNGPARFTFDKTAIWFYSPYNADRAILYYLHTNDARVFGMAIKGASGMTDPVKAAETLSKAVHARFIYSISVSYTDVIDLLENATEAQCADEACCLTALLRSIGIPAHPVTADAAMETGRASWVFDTWTEFLAQGAGGLEWLVLHPHEYPYDPAVSRHTFGTTKGVATNDTDDLIIMANENWVWSEAADQSNDVSFNRNACDQPEQQITAKPWVDHICEQGYWDQSHWDCTGITSYALRIPLGFRLDGPPVRFGGELTGSISIRNDSNRLWAEGVTIELVSHRFECKGLVHETLDTMSHRLMLERERDVTIPFRFHMPSKSAPGYELYLRARTGERTLLLQPIQLPSTIESELRMPNQLHVGEEFALSTVVRNVGHDVVNGISMTLSVPYVIRMRGRRRQQISRIRPREEQIFGKGRLVAQIDSLPAGGEQVLEWVGQALASLEAGTIRLDVSSENGGPSLSMIPMRVLAPSSAPIVLRPVTA